MTEVKFNTDNWRDYYNAEIDEAYVKDLFKEEDHSRVTSADFYGETLDVRLEADFGGVVYPPEYCLKLVKKENRKMVSKSKQLTFARYITKLAISRVTLKILMQL